MRDCERPKITLLDQRYRENPAKPLSLFFETAYEALPEANRSPEYVKLPRLIGRSYAAAISRVALTGNFSTLQSAERFASRGRTRSFSQK